ncbi:MAG: hypothetical protein RPR97_03245, partial [Colwellia sp.]
HEFYPGITHEDNLYTTEILLDDECKRLQLVGDVVYLRRVREGSIMMVKPSAKNYMGYLKIYQMLESKVVTLAGDKAGKKALTRFRAALFVNFARTLVLVHGIRIPILLRLEIWRCWRGAHGALMDPKYMAITAFPFITITSKRAVSYFRRFVG